MLEDVDSVVDAIARMTPKELTQLVQELGKKAPEAKNYLQHLLTVSWYYGHIGPRVVTTTLPYFQFDANKPVHTSGYADSGSHAPTSTSYGSLPGASDAVMGC